MGTRFSTRSLEGPATSAAPTCAAGAGTGLGASVDWAGCFCSFRYLLTSSLVMRPPLPDPAIAAASIPCSSIRARAAGPMAGSAAPESPVLASDTGSGEAVLTAPGSNRASNASLTMVSPSGATIEVRTPDSGATTSMTTLSVSISTNSSSRATESPSALCQVATSPSATDSGNAGALISIAILYSYLKTA